MSSPYYTSALGPDDFVDVFDGLRHPTPPQHGKHGHGHHGRGHPERPSDSQHFYNDWFGTSSAPHADALLVAADALRKVYPKHSMVITSPYSADVLGFPGANFKPMEKTPLVATAFFVPIPRSAETVPGFLVDQLQFAAFEGNALGHDYLIYHVMVPAGFGSQPFYLILHEGPEEVARLLVLSAGAYQNELHEEIWVFNQGFWSKDHGLWVEAQKASWDDVILKDEFKKALQKDVYGFFDSRDIYKELSIPWKRGLIMYGPPGNGKTISLKTIIKTCDDKGFRPLYVKSFQSYMGEEGAMAVVFRKARELAPCVLVLEDIDSLINDRNRSFFLNQLDGLEGNDGLLIIGTTNHFDRLDPGLSTRPSRFDRKYKFDDPDEEERKLYARYWQNKLKSNKEIEFPDSLVDEVAKATDRFSFAYLKEAFVSSLVTYVGIEGDKPLFSEILFKEIDQLRQQLDKQFTNIQDYYTPMARMRISDSPSSQPGSPNMHHQRGHGKRGQYDHSADNSHFRHVLDRLTPGNVANPAQNKIFVAGRPSDMRVDRQVPSQSRAARGYAPTYIGDKDMMSGLGL